MLLAIFLKAGINLNDILINSSNDNLHVHKEDFKIASNISSKLGFKLNNFKLDKKGTLLNYKESLFCTLYSKMGFHKEYYLIKKFFTKPRFHFTGGGGEIIRGYPGKPIQKYIESLSSNSRKIIGHQKEFYEATLRLCNRSVELFKKKKTYKNDYEIAGDLYKRGRTRSHYGTASYENFISNTYSFQPMIDSDINRIKLDIKDSLALDIESYILVRFAHNLINFPFDGKRFLNPESIKKAEILNKKFEYLNKFDFKQNFYIDKKRKCPVSLNDIKYNKDANEYIKDLVNSNKIYYYINKVYDDSVYKWSIEKIERTKFFPFRHIYSLLAIAKKLEDISINHEKLGLIQNNNEGKIKQHLFE